jgi:hypothetical protein
MLYNLVIDDSSYTIYIRNAVCLSAFAKKKKKKKLEYRSFKKNVVFWDVAPCEYCRNIKSSKYLKYKSAPALLPTYIKGKGSMYQMISRNFSLCLHKCFGVI